jgi:hypothetical protein
MHVGLVASFPAAAMNPHDDREALAGGRRINIEHLPFVVWFGVGDATLSLRPVGQEWGGKEEDEEERDDAHGSLQMDCVLFNLIGRLNRKDHLPAPCGAGTC